MSSFSLVLLSSTVVSVESSITEFELQPVKNKNRHAMIKMFIIFISFTKCLNLNVRLPNEIPNYPLSLGIPVVDTLYL